MKKEYTGAYWAPKDLSTAIECYQVSQGAVFLAGGTDLKPTVHSEYSAIIDLKKIPELNAFGENTGGEYELGSLTTIRQLETNHDIGILYPVIRDAAAVFGSRQIRERATIGGNICNGSPSADIAIALLSMSPCIVWRDPTGEYRQTLEEYYEMPVELRPNMRGFILEKILLSIPDGASIGSFFKLGSRKALEVSIVSVAISSWRLVDGQTVTGIAMGSVGPTPLRAHEAEEILNEELLPWDKRTILSAVNAAAEASIPRDDIWASAEYRKEMIRTYVKRGIESIQRGDSPE